jgi:hypothetical protein
VAIPATWPQSLIELTRTSTLVSEVSYWAAADGDTEISGMLARSPLGRGHGGPPAGARACCLDETTSMAGSTTSVQTRHQRIAMVRS